MTGRIFSTCGKLVLGFPFQRVMSESGAKEEQRPSELDSPIWSVIAFDRCEASGLTYREATNKIIELEACNVSGLCVVTDAAAAKVAT